MKEKKIEISFAATRQAHVHVSRVTFGDFRWKCVEGSSALRLPRVDPTYGVEKLISYPSQSTSDSFPLSPCTRAIYLSSLCRSCPSTSKMSSTVADPAIVQALAQTDRENLMLDDMLKTEVSNKASTIEPFGVPRVEDPEAILSDLKLFILATGMFMAWSCSVSAPGCST